MSDCMGTCVMPLEGLYFHASVCVRARVRGYMRGCVCICERQRHSEMFVFMFSPAHES